MTQFSLFGAAVATPTPDDLGGLLLAGGHWVRHGSMARLSVVVPDRWRADALVTEFGERGVLGPDAVVRAEDGWSVRTAFTDQLSALAAAWSRGANEGAPADFTLSSGGLRLWTIASGRRDEAGYLLGTARPDSALHLAAGSQLARMGLAAVSIGVRGRCGWRLTSAKRLRRFTELVGAAPEALNTDPGSADATGHWPR